MLAAIHSHTQTMSTGPLNVSLWTAQALLFGLFASAGAMKLSMPIPKIAKMWPWTGQVPKAFLRFIGVVDLAGGLGILLPGITHIPPELTFVAALCCSLLQVAAIVFHIRRGEAASTPFNFFVLALCLFVLWGR